MKYNRVAIIDDDPINNLICEKVIQRAAFSSEVTSFLSAIEALDWLKAQAPENWPKLIFLDINLPYMDGWEFLTHLPAQHGCTIYILSSSVSEEDQSKARENQQVRGFLIKPLTLEKLNDLEKASQI